MGERFDLVADELYGLPLEEFVPRRDALARELRATGERDDADRVKRLPKPSAPAWAVNRLVREHPDEIRALIEAGHELRRVQEWLLRREADPADLRTAVDAERTAVAQLVRMGAELLTAAGRAPRGDVLERIGETLHAAAADPQMRAELERGRVVNDRAAVGLGEGVAAAPAGTTRRAGGSRRRAVTDVDAGAEEKPAPKPRRGEEAEPRRSAAARDAALQAARAAEADAKASERMRAAADRAVDRAARALEAAESSWERAREQLREAREDVAAAEKAADAAREAAETARAEAEERRRRADEADT